jgi:sulfur carrier protein ThiS adenylyltransferase
MTSSDDRYLRQRDLVPAEKLARVTATIAGVGAIGRQVSLQLAAMCVPRLQLVDPDTVEEVNLPVQGYLEADLGQAKVDATATLIRQINSTVQLELHRERFRRTLQVGDTLFCCVDSIATRKLIWEAVQNRVSFFVDGRMSAEVIRVLAAGDEPSRQHYPATLFAQDEAFVGACTAKSTIYAANIAAGLMVSHFARWLRSMPIDADVTLNLLSAEMAAGV